MSQLFRKSEVHSRWKLPYRSRSPVSISFWFIVARSCASLFISDSLNSKKTQDYGKLEAFILTSTFC